MGKPRTCQSCKFSILEDHGYSNYTVDGTTFYCGLDLHPDGSFDRYYGEDKRLLFGKTCEAYVEGEGVYMDVDHEEEIKLTGEQKAIYERRWPEWQKANGPAKPYEDALEAVEVYEKLKQDTGVN